MKVDLHDPATWPLPMLPLVRKTGGLFPECGVMLPGVPVVYAVNMTEATAAGLARCEKHWYLNFEELAADGWMVD